MKNVKNFYKLSEIYTKYKEKLVTADQAVSGVKSGDAIHYGLMCGVVVDLDKALAKRASELENVIICDTMWCYPEPPEVLKVDPEAKHFKYSSSHFTGTERNQSRAGNCWFLPVQFRENTKAYLENRNPFEYAMLQVGPMDSSGNFNLGPNICEYWGVINNSKKVIVEVNKNLPMVHGIQNSINIAQVDMIVEGSNTMPPTLKAKEATDGEKKMAGYIAEMIESGSTLQLGTGGFPNFVGKLVAESDVNNLSVHTEMFVDAYLHLYEAGKITGNKNINPGKMTFTFALGSNDLYRWIDGNPMMQVAPVDYVNSSEIIAANDKVVSVNSCLQVDLFGQVNSESAGVQHISGTGGQLDFVMGAFKSKGGKSFLCTPSTRVGKDGTLSSLIMPTLPQGTIVSTPRSGVHWIVTENGAVNLKGKTTWERAELLISIAHPDFQEQLIKEAEKMGIWRNTSKISY